MTCLPAVACLVAVLGPGQARAHAKLLSATPAANATVASAPLIQLRFSEELTKQFSSLKLTDTDGDPVALKSVAGEGDSDLQASPAMPLASGLYTVWWVAVSTDDGHKVSGNFSFTVQAPG
jgi:hypothetical protein